MKNLTAADIMARSEATLRPDMDIYGAMKELLGKKLTGAPVVTERGVLVGMLTERDCLKVLVGWVMDNMPRGKVTDYMSAPVVSVGPAASLYDVVHIFLTKPYRKLPVVDADEQVVGQVSRRDALVALASFAEKQGMSAPEEALSAELPAGEMGVDSAMKIARGQK
jgi:CBS-domain-containing membrane protein